MWCRMLGVLPVPGHRGVQQGQGTWNGPGDYAVHYNYRCRRCGAVKYTNIWNLDDLNWWGWEKPRGKADSKGS